MKKTNIMRLGWIIAVLTALLWTWAAAEGTLTLPADTKEIGEQAFYGLPGVREIILPDGVLPEHIGDGAFGGSESLRTVETDPDFLSGMTEEQIAALEARLFPDSPNARLAAREAEPRFTYEISGDHVIITGPVDETMTEAKIPGRIQGLPVTEIGASAFSNNRSLRKVEMPDSVTTIGNYAFYYCEYLTEVTFPASLAAVGDRAFYRCGNSVSGEYTFRLPDGLESGGQYAFACKAVLQCGVNTAAMRTLIAAGNQFCLSDDHTLIYGGDTWNGEKALFLKRFTGDKTTLTALEIPEGVVGIGDEAFASCKKLTDITFPSTLKKLGKKSFQYCGKDAAEPFFVFLPDGLEEMTFGGRDASFLDKSDLLTYECNPAGAAARKLCALNEYFEFTAAGAHDFIFRYADHTEPTETDSYHKEKRLYLKYYLGSDAHVTVPAFTEVIGNRAFCLMQTASKNTTMTRVTLADTLVAFDQDAFENCTALTSVQIPEGITEISAWCFKNCENLTQVTFPGTLKSIRGSAFAGCGTAAAEPFVFELPPNITGSSSYPFDNCPAVLVTDRFSRTAKWLGGVDDQSVQYASYSFADPENPDIRYTYKNVTEDGADVPYLYVTGYKGSAAEVVIPEGAVYIGNKAFQNNTALSRLVIPEGVRQVDENAFDGCTALTDVTFPQSLKVLKSRAFADIGSASEARHYYILPDTMTEISVNTAASWGAFGGKDGLNRGVLVCSAGSETAKLLSNCYTGGVNGAYNFAPKGHHTDGLLYRYIREGASDNYQYRLNLWDYWRYDQETVVIPEDIGLYGISQYGDGWKGTFKGHSELKKAVIPNGVIVVRDSAFRDCTMLSDLSLGNTVQILENHAFENVGKNAGTRFVVVLPASVTKITAGTGAGWDTFEGSGATLAALNSYTRKELHDNWYYYYLSEEDAMDRVNVQYQRSDNPNQEYKGRQ